jgi:hypothetical protein
MSNLAPEELVRRQEQLLEELGYQFCTRDERVVLDDLREHGEVDSMYGLETASVVDEFFCFLRELGLWEKLDALKPAEQERQMLPLTPLVLLYFLKTISGIKAMNALPDLLFANRALMQLVGFSGHVLEKGLCRRGEYRRKGEKRSIPLCPDMMRNNLVGMSLETVSDFFNETVRALARLGAYGRKIRAHIDASTIVTTAKAKGAGKITQKKTVRTKTGEVREYEVHVYGWKFTTAWDAKSGLPVAAGFGKINQGDREFLFQVIAQARENLKGSGSELREVVMDGGYLDGTDLYELDRQGLTWVTRGWISLNVVKEAVELSDLGKGGVRERTTTATLGKGKNARQMELRSRVAGIAHLESFDTYGPADHTQSAANSKSFEPIPVNAVVVKEWKGKVPDDPEVYLTNGSVDDPFAVADTYDERSEIENRLHRELKQSYHLEHLLQKSEPGAYVHLYLLLSLYALVRAFRVWKREEDKRAVRGRGSTLQSFRRDIERENLGLVIVFDGQFYGIFAYADLMSVMAKMKFRKINPVCTWEELYLKYTGQPP